MHRALPPAYVLWLGPTGLNIVRALGREGIPVVGCHHDVNEPGVGTKYARVKILPPLESNPDAWMSFLLSEANTFAPQKAVLMVAGDPEWQFVAEHRTQLDEHFLIALPHAPDVALWMTKPWQANAAARAGIPMPRSMPARSTDDLARIAPVVDYPAVLKPTVSHKWREHYPHKLAFVRSAAELVSSGSDALAKGLEFTVQEYVPARDDDIYSLYCALDRTSNPLALCVSHKIRQFEPRFGSGCMCECAHEPRVVELGLRFLRSIGYHGIASVEFKLDSRDGEFKMMEANLRSPLMMGHAIDAGVNIPLACYRDLINDPLPIQLPKRLGNRVGIFAHDWHSAKFYRSIGELKWRTWLCQWLRARDLHFAWDDMAPFKGYVHMLWDHYRKREFAALPSHFPTIEQWKSGEFVPDPASPSSTSIHDPSVCIAT